VKRILVTGASGFIGRSTLPPLLALGYEVHATSSRSAGERSAQGVQWHRVDLMDRAQVDLLMAKVIPSHLFHLAWYTAPGLYRTSAENLRWVGSSLYLIEQFLRFGGRRVMVAGTCAEYEWSDGLCRETTTPMSPKDLYAVSKHALHLMLTSWSEQMKFSLAWGRVFFLYGPSEHPKRLVASVVRSLLNDQPALCTTGDQKRDFLHVDDVANALVAVLDSDVEGPVNIGSGDAVAIRDIVGFLGRQLGTEDLLRFGAVPTPRGEQPVVVAAVDRLRQEVSWKPRYTLEAGLTDTVEWWKEQYERR